VGQRSRLPPATDADAAAERGQAIGDGTPVHVTIPTPNPWVPIRILSLGKTGGDVVEADVYLLTDRAPALLPAPGGSNGMRVDHSDRATQSLLDDLRSDTGMGWVPTGGWLTKIAIDADATLLSYDLAIDASGNAAPSIVQAGLQSPAPVFVDNLETVRILLAATIAIGVALLVALLRRPTGTTAGLRPQG
jgi:hypothetical protein